MKKIKIKHTFHGSMLSFFCFIFLLSDQKFKVLKKKQVTYPHFPMMGKLDCCNIHQIAGPYDTQQV